MKSARSQFRSIFSVLGVGCMALALAACSARTPATTTAAPSSAPATPAVGVEQPSTQSVLSAQLLAEANNIIGGASFSMSPDDQRLLTNSIANAVAELVRTSNAAEGSPSAEQIDNLRAAVARYATDITTYGNAVVLNLPQVTDSGDQVAVFIESESSAKRVRAELVRRELSVARSAAIGGLLGGLSGAIRRPTASEPSDQNALLCLDAPKVQELRDRVAAFLALGGQAAIPAKALFDAMLQTSTKLPSLRRRNQVEPAEGLCVLANTMNALDTLMGPPTPTSVSSASVPVGAGRIATAQARSLSPREVQTAISAPNPEPKKPVLWGLPDLFAPLCPFYPAC
jgi:hypothetical protein